MASLRPMASRYLDWVDNGMSASWSKREIVPWHTPSRWASPACITTPICATSGAASAAARARIGPAGTGKTYLAVTAALAALEAGEVGRIVLTRPAVEAGERLG